VKQWKEQDLKVNNFTIKNGGSLLPPFFLKKFLNRLHRWRGLFNMIEFKEVSLVYPNGTQGLKNVNVKINEGEFVVIVGLSGAGKSTLIRSINRLVTPTSGELLVDNEDILPYKGAALRSLRTKVGMIFQNYNLVKRSSVMKNVIAGRLGHTST
jgi:phosphonate transport system ATP-binding protein